MKRLAAIIVFTTMVLAAMPAFAEEWSTHFTFQGWFAHYEQTLADDKLTGYTMMSGPSLKLKYGDYSIMGAYMATVSDFRFDLGADGILLGKKSDIKLELGYNIGEMVVLHAGWKQDLLELDNAESTTSSGEITISGPTFGVTGHVPVGESGVTMLGNFSIMYLEVYNDMGTLSTETENRNAFSMQIGMTYKITRRLSLETGYVHQIYVSDDDENDIMFSGAYLTIVYGI